MPEDIWAEVDRGGCESNPTFLFLFYFILALLNIIIDQSYTVFANNKDKHLVLHPAPNLRYIILPYTSAFDANSFIKPNVTEDIILKLCCQAHNNVCSHYLDMTQLTTDNILNQSSTFW